MIRKRNKKVKHKGKENRQKRKKSDRKEKETDGIFCGDRGREREDRETFKCSGT